MPRRFLRNALAWLCLLLQLAAGSSSAAGLVMCMEDDGSVAIETRLSQAACCGELANRHEESRSEPVLVEGDGCTDAPLSLPASLGGASPRTGDDASPALLAVPAADARLASRPPAPVASPPNILARDGTLLALRTVILLA